MTFSFLISDLSIPTQSKLLHTVDKFMIEMLKKARFPPSTDIAKHHIVMYCYSPTVGVRE